MATITYDAEGPGQGASRPLFVQGPRPIKVVTGKFDFDASYPTGGESISDIADQFANGGFLGCVFEGKGGYIFEVDYTADAEKVKALHFDYDAAADGTAIEVPNATDLSGVTGVRFMAWGYPGMP